MVIFPNSKINLGLNIVGKRSDGYHDIETIFFPVHLKDALEVIEKEKFEFSTSGSPIEGDPEKNLCIKAYNLLKKDFPQMKKDSSQSGDNSHRPASQSRCTDW